MSQEIVEVVKALFHAVNRHDVEAILALAAPDIEIVSGLLPDQGIRRGHEGLRAYRESLRDVYGDSFHVDPEEFIDVGDRVVVVGSVTGTSLTTGLALDMPVAQVCTPRGGKIARVETFDSRRLALEAVGLREYAMSPETVE